MMEGKDMDKQVSLMTGRECTSDELGELTNIEFAIDKTSPWLRGIEIYVRGENWHLSSDKKFVVDRLMLKEYDPTALGCAPAFTVSFVAAQNLMDELWAAGVRPSELNVPATGTVDAVSKHLEDMRKIAFGFLEGDDGE